MAKPAQSSKRNKYKGGFEPLVAKQLQRLKARAKYEPTKIPYTLAFNYIPDFVLPNGTILEVKGRLRSEDRRKLRAVKEQNPHLDIRIVFQRANNKLSKGSKTTYSEWAERYGFPWCEGKVPKSWVT